MSGGSIHEVSNENEYVNIIMHKGGGGGTKAKGGEGPICHVGGILELHLHVRVIGRRQGPLFTIDCSKHSNFESLLLNNFFSNKARDFDISIQRFFKNYLL